jgi:NhaP-type Na+/H+ or K+/H+ antiporter
LAFHWPPALYWAPLSRRPTPSPPRPSPNVCDCRGRIVTILEGESLINDATALVAYRFGIAALATGAFSLPRATGEFFLVVIGGPLIGIIMGWAAAWFHRHVDDPPIEITVSFLTPFLAYLVAERLHLSGVLAVVGAGLYLGWLLPEITTSGTRLQGEPFWNMVEFHDERLGVHSDWTRVALRHSCLGRRIDPSPRQ